MKKFFLASMIVLMCSAAFAQSTVTLGPYLQKVTQTGIVIKWWTDDTTTTAKVMYGTDPNNLTLTATDTTLSSRHSVSIGGLSPYTRYYYALYDGNTRLEGSADHTWRTFPSEGNDVPVRAWVIGDFGKGNEKQRRVHEAYTAYDTVGTDLWLWLGDNVYDDGLEQEYVNKVFTGANGYQQIMKGLPFQPTPGNHDYNVISPVVSTKSPPTHTGPYYDFVDVYDSAQAGGQPSGYQLYYSFDYSNAHFISLNSELGSPLNTAHDWTGARFGGGFTTSPMLEWLKADLDSNKKDWVIIYLHQPPYTDGSHESTAWYEVYMKAIRENFAPVWEAYGVDLVICGHTHVYERSYLVKGAYGDPDEITPFNFVQTTSGKESLGEAYLKYTTGQTPNQGTVYVNNGNSGSSETSASFNHPYMYSEYGCDTCCGSLVLDIVGKKLVGRHLTMDGNIYDEFTIYKDYVASINDVTENESVGNFKVMPNPFSNATSMSFDLKKDANVSIRLNDMVGKTYDVFKGDLKAGSHAYQVDAAKLQLAKGTYILSINTGSSNAAKTVIKID